MPIPVGLGAPPPPTPPPAPPISDAFVATWIDPENVAWPLMTAKLGWHSLDALAGVHGAVPVSITSDADPGGGATVRHIQPQPRLMTWALRIDGPGETDHRGRYRALARAFTLTRRLGAGTITIARSDGTVRQIKAVYQDGFDPTPGDMSGWLYSTVVLTLYCPDPYWSDVDPTPFHAEVAADPDADYQDPLPTISSSTTLGDQTVNNPGDAEAWPGWVINGPATLITATNNRIGKTFTIDPNAAGIAHGDLVLGETVTITSKPPKVRGPDGSVWTAALGFPSNANLWWLEPGDNDVTLSITGAGDGSGIVGQFLARWETP